MDSLHLPDVVCKPKRVGSQKITARKDSIPNRYFVCNSSGLEELLFFSQDYAPFTE